MKCCKCDEPADFIPRIKRGVTDWVTYGELSCCDRCSPAVASEVAKLAGSGHATQLIPYPDTAYQREAALNPAAHAARLRQKRLSRPQL